MSILRLWRGVTHVNLADEYERLLRDQHFPSIAARDIPGFRQIDFVRRPLGDQVEVGTLMWFDSLDDVELYAGKDIDKAAIAPAAERLLSQPDRFVSHFDVKFSVKGKLPTLA
jgi:antibiotic biosynthesis monooxygenase (ABM) superfamily enzyme